VPGVILKLDRLTKSYGTLKAVDNLSLEVFEGEIFGFLGPNGAGKTTTINMMCSLLQPDSGQVLIQNVPISEGDTKIRARIGVCPQEVVLWDRLTCIEQLQFMGEMYGLAGSEAKERGEHLIHEFDLLEKANTQAYKLSGGMRRRLNLAMSLIHDPDILILDEPEVGLDPQSRVKIREYIQSLANEKTVILTTHNMDEADRIADRVAIMDHGKILVLDTPEALKRSVGEGSVLELQLSADKLDEEKVRAALLDLGDEVRVDIIDGTLNLHAPDVLILLPRVTERLSAIGVDFGEVHIRESTLEDVFIHLTGRRLRS
jgi:ABC-2 type transport system ATP-binding protein